MSSRNSSLGSGVSMAAADHSRVPGFAARTHHPCPGGCGSPIPNRYFSCGRHWRQLPNALRRQILRTADRQLGDPERQHAWVEATQYLMSGVGAPMNGSHAKNSSATVAATCAHDAGPHIAG